MKGNPIKNLRAGETPREILWGWVRAAGALWG